MTEPLVPVLLSCGHVHLWTDALRPKHGKWLYCTKCNDGALVVGGVGDWIAECFNCTFRRTYVTPLRCSTGVRKHIRRFPNHRIALSRVGQDGRLIAEQDEPRTIIAQDGLF